VEEPLVQIRGRRVFVSRDEARIARAREALERDWVVRLPALLDGPTLEGARAALRDGRWKAFDHSGIALEACLVSDRTIDALEFQLNEPALLRLIERVADAPRIGRFSGRIYRVEPDAGHFDSWHSDTKDHRRVALTLNLSEGVYTGSSLEMREKDAEVVRTFSNLVPGDGMLFRIAPTLEHRLTPLEGTVPKTALAGWFREQPDFHAPFRRGS
jgi:hypothetical protein